MSLTSVTQADPPAQADYWNPPRLTSLPKDYKTYSGFPYDYDQYYGLSPVRFVPSGEWAVVAVYFVDSRNRPNLAPENVGLLAINIRSKKTIFLALPESDAGYEYQLEPYVQGPLLSSEEVAVVLTCSVSGKVPADVQIPARRLLYSWNISAGQVKPIGNHLRIESLLGSLSATPYSVSWFDREESNWSGWARITHRRDRKTAGFLQAWRGKGIPDQESLGPEIFAPGSDCHHVLRIQNERANRPTLKNYIESLDLSQAGKVIWRFDQTVAERELGYKTPELFMRFAQGLTSPTKTIPILANYEGDHRGTDVWLLDASDGTIKQRYQIQESPSFAFYPFVSSNARYLAANLNDDKSLCIIDFETETIVRKPGYRDQFVPLVYVHGIADDGTLLLKDSSAVYLLAPPYDGDRTEIFKLPELDPKQ